MEYKFDHIGSIVGRSGSIPQWIRQIEDESGANVEVKNRGHDHRVEITGTTEQAEKAIAVVQASMPQFDRVARLGPSKYRCLLPPHKAFKVFVRKV